MTTTCCEGRVGVPKLMLKESFEAFVSSGQFEMVKSLIKEKLEKHDGNSSDQPEVKKLQEKLDGVRQTLSHDLDLTIAAYDQLFERHGKPEILYERGRAMMRFANLMLDDVSHDEVAERSNELMIRATKEGFCRVLELEKVSKFQLIRSGRLCIELCKKLGLTDSLVMALERMHERYPDKFEYASSLAFELLLKGNVERSESMFDLIVRTWPDECGPRESYLLGLCQKILHPAENDERVDGLIDLAKLNETESSRTFSLVGTVFMRKGWKEKSDVVFREGVRIGLFMSQFQRSASAKNLRLSHLTARPVWTLEETGYQTGLNELIKNYDVIRTEGIEALSESSENFLQEAENLREEGQWQQLVLLENGNVKEDGCRVAPRTCQLVLRHLREPAAECLHGQVKFSVIHPGTHVFPHSGPSNCRLRAHLGLVVPDDSIRGKLEMRIANNTILHWKEGQMFIIDDSFEHEVWHQKSSGGLRLVLLIDLWHPDLSSEEKLELSPLLDRNLNHTTIFNVAGLSEQTSNESLQKLSHDEL